MNTEQHIKALRKESAAWKKVVAQRDELLVALTRLENAARATHGGLYIENYDAILNDARDAIAKAANSR